MINSNTYSRLFLSTNSMLIFIFLFVACTKAPKNEGADAEKKMKTLEVSVVKKHLRHVVLLKFKDSIDTAEITNIENEFASLATKIQEIRDFEWGTNNSTEGLDKGFTHSFLVTFWSEEDRAIYLPHPDHLAFVEILKPKIADVMVVDYWTED